MSEELRELIHDALLAVSTAVDELRSAMPDDTGWDDLDDAKRKLTRARAIAASPVPEHATPDRDALVRAFRKGDVVLAEWLGRVLCWRSAGKEEAEQMADTALAALPAAKDAP